MFMSFIARAQLPSKRYTFFLSSIIYFMTVEISIFVDFFFPLIKINCNDI